MSRTHFFPMPPAVAVIIPTYNRAPMLERAVHSVLDQTFGDFMLVVVDDGSTDHTAALPLFTNPHPRLRLIRLSENRGVSAARNIGVRQTTAPWLAFLDSDDQWHPEKLEKQMAWLNSHPTIRICQTREIWIRNGKRVNPPRSHEKTGGDLFETSLLRCMITPSSVIMKRSLFDAAGGFDESLPACEDYDLWLRITAHHPVGLVDDYLLTRHGGRDDQLSASIPVLDRFRIAALQKLLQSGTLTQDQEMRARTVLILKAGILANGSLKRGNTNDYEHYKGLVEQHA